MKEEITGKMNIITRRELNYKNTVKAINTKVTPVTAHPMNVCKLAKSELTELDPKSFFYLFFYLFITFFRVDKIK